MRSIVCGLVMIFSFSSSYGHVAVTQCEPAARKAAESLLDVAAESLDLTGQVGSMISGDGQTFEFEAWIYRARYRVNVVVDSSCFPESVRLREILN